VTTSLQGRLLVATPILTDPNFDRTVVYLCFHTEHGAFGLVLNRPLEGVDVGDHLPAWTPHLSPPASLFVGGPVENTAALGLARGAAGEGWTEVGPRLGLVNLQHEPAGTSGIEDLRVFLGYAGWSDGQLEGEIEEGAWLVVDALPGDLFSGDPGSLWRNVLKRQPGDTALLAYAPRDPRAN